MPVKTTNKLLYLDKPPKMAKPEAPKPREANIRPPLQQRDATKAVKTDAMPISFSFILIILSAYDSVEITGYIHGLLYLQTFGLQQFT